MRIVLAIIAILLPAIPAAADIPVPDLDLSTATVDIPAPGPFVLMVRPDGQGPGFAGARDASGNTVDATIEIVLLGFVGFPVEGFPGLDLWLAPIGAPCVNCAGPSLYYGFSVDRDTDSNGTTILSLPPRGGGYNQNDCTIYISSNPLNGPPLPIHWNSPDINGDLAVDLADAGFFTVDLYGAYHFRSDLVYDGVINLSDAGEMSAAMGVRCP